MSEHWNEEQIKDLTGKVVFVTGGNSGLGFESCKVFAKKNATVLLGARNVTKGNDAIKKIREEVPHAQVQLIEIDLASKKSIKKASDEIHQEFDQLDILMNNAGVMVTPYGKTEYGVEQQQGINHFSHFYLTYLLFDLIKKTGGSRIINISSLAHTAGKMDFSDLLFEKKYSKIKAYGRSKLENLLFTLGLKHKIEQSGLDIIVAVAHPGGSRTNLGREMNSNLIYKMVSPLSGFFTQSAYQGALPQIRAAVDDTVKSGDFYGPRGWFGLKGKPVLVKAKKDAYDLDLAEKLWKYSEEVMDITFEI